MINVLIRHTKGRKKELQKCLHSVAGQTYKDLNVIICTDDQEFILPAHSLNGRLREVFYTSSDGVPYHWNFYCNELKERVTDGWFFYLDDDDWIARNHSLAGIAPHLTDPNVGIICQYYRGRLAKPNNLVIKNGHIDPDSIIKGKIGGSAIFLHHSQKNIADWDGAKAADYRFIKAVAEKIPLKFVPIPVVQAGNSGRHGK